MEIADKTSAAPSKFFKNSDFIIQLSTNTGNLAIALREIKNLIPEKKRIKYLDNFIYTLNDLYHYLYALLPWQGAGYLARIFGPEEQVQNSIY